MLVVIIACGCSADEGEEQGAGFAPKIKSIMIWNVTDPDNPVPDFDFLPGESLAISIDAEDLDYNMITLTGTLSYEDDFDTPIADPVVVAMPPQTQTRQGYERILSLKVPQGEVGSYRVYLVIEDAQGNSSDPFPAQFSIVEDDG